MWEGLERDRMVSLADYPVSAEEDLDLDVEEAEEFLKNVILDINEILRVTRMSPKRVNLYTSPAWKQRVFDNAIQMAKRNELSIPSIMKATMSDPDMKKHGKEAVDFARKTAERLVKRSASDVDRIARPIDELRYLTEASSFISKEIGCDVAVFSADDSEAYDPQKKAKASTPRRPAIFVE
jgi:leucyl-tRNA synthetase